MSEHPIIFVDLETTSADATKAEIQEVGLFAVDPQTFEPIGLEFTAQYRALLPELADPAALAIHGLNPREGADPEALMYDVLGFADIALEGKPGVLHLAGHNIGVFDQPLLRRYIPHVMYQGRFHYRLRDTAVVGKYLMDAGLIPPMEKFGEIATFFGSAPSQYHRALPDARDEAKVYKGMVNLGRTLGRK